MKLTIATVLLSCSVMAAAVALPAQQSTPSVPDEAANSYAQCGWYAICGCARNSGVQGPGRLIRTDNFPNFQPGYWCRAQGPYGPAEAQRRGQLCGGYAKSAC